MQHEIGVDLVNALSFYYRHINIDPLERLFVVRSMETLSSISYEDTSIFQSGGGIGELFLKILPDTLKSYSTSVFAVKTG